MIIRTIVISIAILLSVTAAFACRCIINGAGACQDYWNMPVVFSGRVVQIEDIKSGTGDLYNPSKKVRFAVIDAFRGITGETVELHTGSGGGDCGFAFELNESYLVYAGNNNEGKLSTSICTRTRTLAKAAEDIEYILGLPNAKPGARLSGTVSKSLARKPDDYRPNPPLPDIPITITGDKTRFETVTDAGGAYSFADIPAGKYTVSAAVPRGFLDEDSTRQVELFDKGCGAASFWFYTDTSLSGMVRDENGKPAEVSLTLVPSDTLNERSQQGRQFGSSGPDGRFTFRHIPDGRYYLGVRLGSSVQLDFPYPRTFYPGTPDIARAAVIEVHEGNVLGNFDFQLPPKLASRTVSGKIVLPPGVLIKNAHICLEEGALCESTEEMRLKPDGSFKFTAFIGVRYTLRADANGNDRQFFAKPMIIPETGNLKGLKIEVNSATRE
jgi:hypothetical protein